MTKPIEKAVEPVEKVTYVVCRGNTVKHGVAVKNGDVTTVEILTFNQFEPIDLDDEVEHQKLLAAGTIRIAGDLPETPGVKISKG